MMPAVKEDKQEEGVSGQGVEALLEETQNLEQPAIATLSKNHPPMHLIETKKKRLEYLDQPKSTSTDLRV